MPVAALIPIRSFRGGKGRLSPLLDENQRHTLGRGMAERTLTAVEFAGLLPAIVTADLEVERWAIRKGLVLIQETGDGLNGAARQGVEWAQDLGLNWMVIHSDLPIVTGDDIVAVREVVESGENVIAPSADGGTTVLSSQTTIVFTYGPGSFHRHLGLVPGPVIIATPGLLHDLDGPPDLSSALSHPEGAWLRSIAKMNGT